MDTPFKHIPLLNIILFVLTCLSTVFVGALYKGIDPFLDPKGLIGGIPFSFAIMAILVAHELSHYFYSIKHHIDATLPYFIPAPFSPIGTFGAFIKMKSPIYSKIALLDIGA